MKKDFIPENDTVFNGWQANLTAYVLTNKVRFNIPDDSWDSLGQMKSVWEAKYVITGKPETRTTPAVQAKNEAKKNYVSELRKFIKGFLQYNPAVTDEDRASMGLPIHSTSRKPVPTPTTHPEFDVDTSMMRRLNIRFRDAGKNTSAKPFGVHGAEIRWAILNAPPSTVDELVNVAFDTRTPFMLEFADNERGKTVYFCLRWENTRSVKGPWGAFGSAVIP